MNVLEQRKAAEAASLSRMGTAILQGKKIGVRWLPEESDELGYTSGAERIVNVAWDHRQIFEGLEEAERAAMRMGVFAHELLHQCLTNFRYTDIVCQTMSRAEASILMAFANTIEDPAIEFFAPQIFGGRLLEALRFSIRQIYLKSSGIERSRSAFGQLINALIMFGDMGIVKGTFTYPEAYEYFKKVAPIYNEAIICPDSKQRIDYAKECMEITKPLWEEDVKDREEFEKLLEELKKFLESEYTNLADEMEKRLKEGSGSTDAEKKRKKILEKMDPSKAKDGKADDSADEGGEGDESPFASDSSEDGTSSTDDGSSAGKGKSGEKDAEGEGESGSDGDFGGSDAGEDAPEGESGSSSSATGSPADGTPSDGPEKSGSIGGEITTPEQAANKKVEEEYEVSETAIEQIEESINAEMEKAAKDAKKDASEGADDLPNFDISSSAFKSASCINRKVKAPHERTSTLYNGMKTAYTGEIKTLTKALDKIFKSDREEEARTTSGSYNIKRGAIGTSARIFDKRRDPANLKDAAVCLCVDLSGSMHGSKEAQARKTAIVFAEALTQLKIPYYIMGFTADRGADAEHLHFVDWNNRKVDRESLALMAAGGNNFDGYSIRYAAHLLANRQAANKLLIVISDGEPACCKYNRKSGIADTIMAIKEARKVCTTFGIAIGTGCSPRVLQGMYGKDFIHCTDEKLLTKTLGKKLEKLLQKGA